MAETKEVIEEQTTEEMTEGVTIVGDILENLAYASRNLKETTTGSDERTKEDKIYENHVEKLIEYERLELDKAKFALEDRKAYLLTQLEEKRVNLEERKAELIAQQEEKKDKNEMVKFWVSSGINLTRILSSIFLGIASLKYNLKFGGLQDRDMQHWLKELFKRD